MNTFKVHLAEEIRRVTLKDLPKFQEFLSSLHDLFGARFSLETHSIQYKDEEGDSICVSSDDEWTESLIVLSAEKIKHFYLIPRTILSETEDLTVKKSNNERRRSSSSVKFEDVNNNCNNNEDVNINKQLHSPPPPRNSPSSPVLSSKSSSIINNNNNSNEKSSSNEVEDEDLLKNNPSTESIKANLRKIVSEIQKIVPQLLNKADGNENANGVSTEDLQKSCREVLSEVNLLAPALLAGQAKSFQDRANLILTQVNLYAQLFLFGGLPFLQSLGRDAWIQVSSLFSGFKDINCKDILPKDLNLKEHIPKFDFEADFNRLNENARAGATHLSNEIQNISVSVLCYLGSTLLAHNRPVEAKSVLEVAVETNPSSSLSWYLLACAHSLLSLTPELLSSPQPSSQSPSLPSSVSRDEKRRKRLIDEALKCLNRAIDEGYSDVDQLSQESNLFPLAHLDEFQQIIHTLTEKRNASVSSDSVSSSPSQPEPEPSSDSVSSSPSQLEPEPSSKSEPSPASVHSSSSSDSSDDIDSYVFIHKEPEQSRSEEIVENNSELEKKYTTELSFLRDMGFANTSVNLALLVAENGNLSNVLSHLIN